jgi:hypothetical protein
VRASVWPRQLIPVAVFYLLAAAAYRKDRGNGQLLPLTSGANAPAVQVAEA